MTSAPLPPPTGGGCAGNPFAGVSMLPGTFIVLGANGCFHEVTDASVPGAIPIGPNGPLVPLPPVPPSTPVAALPPNPPSGAVNYDSPPVGYSPGSDRRISQRCVRVSNAPGNGCGGPGPGNGSPGCGTQNTGESTVPPSFDLGLGGLGGGLHGIYTGGGSGGCPPGFVLYVPPTTASVGGVGGGGSDPFVDMDNDGYNDNGNDNTPGQSTGPNDNT